MKARQQPREVTALDLPDIDAAAMPADLAAYFDKCESKLGFVPNVLVAHAFDPLRLRHFADLYNRLMMGRCCWTRRWPAAKRCWPREHRGRCSTSTTAPTLTSPALRPQPVGP